MAPVGPGALAFDHVKTFELRETDMNGPVVNADHREAERFLLLLTEIRRRVDHQIGLNWWAKALAEGGGYVDLADGLRRLMQIEEQERQVVDELIDQLHQHFPRREPGEVPMIPRRARSVVR